VDLLNFEAINATGAGGVKIAVLRKGLASLEIILAVAQWRTVRSQVRYLSDRSPFSIRKIDA